MELKTYFAQDAAGNIISSAIVNVFLQGTTTLATGLTRADGTPLENPFAADGAGRIQFRAPDGYYDVQVSAGPGIIQTLTIQCVDYTGAKDAATRAEDAADRADASAEQVADAVSLRGDLAAPGGAGIAGGLAKPVTWSGFAGGADPTGVLDSTAAFLAANATKSKIYVPSGRYRLSQDVISDPLTSWELEMDVLFISGYWLRQVPWLSGVGNNIYYYLERHSRNIGIAPRAGIGIYGSAHPGSEGGAALGVAGTAINDGTPDTRSSVWALYGSAIRNAGTIGASHGLELDIANRGDERELYPNSMFPNGQTHALWLGSGGELTQAGEVLNAASAAIGIIANDKTEGKTARFLKGIVFGSDSLKGTDGGSAGQAVAIAFGNRHSMSWYNNANQKTAEILSTTEDETKSLRLTFTDFGVSLNRLSSAQPIFSVEAGPTNPVNYIAIRPQSTENPPALGVAGSDANIDLRLSPKGSGTVRVDTAITPTSPNTNTVGSATRPWAGGFTQTAYTVTSDEDCKSDPLEMTDAILDAAEEVQLVQYQYLDRIEEKGNDGARWHFGAIAQRYVEAFERHGLDAHRFGFICYDEWGDSPAVIDEDTGDVITPAIEAGSRYGIRYEEMLVMEAALQRRNYARLLDKYETLAARINALEAK